MSAKPAAASKPAAQEAKAGNGSSSAGVAANGANGSKAAGGDKGTTPMAAGMQKKSTRRGIRLKVDNGNDSEFE